MAASLVRCTQSSVRKCLSLEKFRCIYPIHSRFISTKKKDETVSPIESYKTPVTEEQFANPKGNQNWISYGFDSKDKTTDRIFTHFMFFGIITLVFCGGSFILAYMPDHRMENWSIREAYLQLDYREKNGLPLIDRNFVDPEKVVLPSEEEIGDFPINI